MKTALITGITGQVGSYLAEYLLGKGYKVIGLHRRTSLPNFERLSDCIDNPNLIMEEFDITDAVNVNNVVSTYHPDEIYNMAAMSHVHTSFTQPAYTFKVNTLGVNFFLDAIKSFSPKTKFVTASTSEMFGSNYDRVGNTKVQNENTAFTPQSPYAISKLAAHEMVRLYRDAYGLSVSTVIMFNNESPRRGEQFVTRKITKWIAKFKKWRTSPDITFDKDTIYDEFNSFPKLRLGNLEASRDWGCSIDFVEGIHMVCSADHADDFVLSTGVSHTIREFLDICFDYIGISDWSDLVVQDPKFFRPAEVDYLLGDSMKIRKVLGWRPKVELKELAKMMIDSDIEHEKKL